jgi:hypothetical protein
MGQPRSMSLLIAIGTPGGPFPRRRGVRGVPPGNA